MKSKALKYFPKTILKQFLKLLSKFAIYDYITLQIG